MTDFNRARELRAQHQSAKFHGSPGDTDYPHGEGDSDGGKDEVVQKRDRFYWAGGTMLRRVRKVERSGSGLGNRKMKVTLNNGDKYLVEQLDRDYFEVTGPHFNGRVDGWNDAMRLIDQI